MATVEYVLVLRDVLLVIVSWLPIWNYVNFLNYYVEYGMDVFTVFNSAW